MSAKLLSIFAIALILFSYGQVAICETESEPEAQVSEIDPLDPSAGDFLDADVADIHSKARDAFLAGEYEAAAALYLSALKRNIGDSDTIYNLACCYGQLGDANLAAKYLLRAFNAGYERIDWVKEDPDFEEIRKDADFKAAIDEIEAELSEKNAKYGELVRVDSPAYFDCYVRLPENYDPSKSYTLVIGLHGYGSNPKRFVQLWDRAGGLGFIYAAPQAPYAMDSQIEGGSFSWISWSESEPSLYMKSASKSENYVVRTANKLKSEYRIDRVLLLGFSQGCAMTYATGLKYPDEFDGLMCFGGWLNTEWIGLDKIASAKDLPVFIAHGREDKSVGFDEGARANEELTSAGYAVEFFEFDGAHTVPVDALNAAARFFELTLTE